MWWHAPFFCRLGRSHTSINLPMVDEVVEQVGAGVAIEFQPRDIEMLFHDRSAFLLTIKRVVANGRRRKRPTRPCRPLKAPRAVHCAAAIWQSSRPRGMLLLPRELLLIRLLEANGCCWLHLELEPLLLP